MTKQQIYAVYARVLTCLSCEVAAAAGLEYRRLEIFRSGLGSSTGLSDAELHRLDSVLGVEGV